MFPGKKKKITLHVGRIICASAFIAAFVFVHAALPVQPFCTHLGAPLYTRFSYIFVHASWLHLLINAAAVVSIARSSYRVPPAFIAIALAIAVSIPLTTKPTAGASAAIFALFGLLSPQAANKRFYHAYMLAPIAVGLVVPAINAPAHLYAYLLGTLIPKIYHAFKK